jgi:nitrate/nitrite transporter NarK
MLGAPYSLPASRFRAYGGWLSDRCGATFGQCNLTVAGAPAGD